MKLFSYIILSFLFILLLGCPNDTSYDIVGHIKIENKSEIDILYIPWYVFKEEYSNNNSILYKDHNPWYEAIDDYLISPDSCINHAIDGKLAYSIIHESNLVIFLFSADSVERIPWERIIDENIILKRVDIFSVDQLDSMNWTINYP